jgi:membrane associated rhomboid family serine protease
MFLPIGDHPNPRGFPLINWLLIAANVAVFVLISLPLSSQRPDLGDPATLAYVELISEVARQPPAAVYAQLSAYDVFLFSHGYRPAVPQWDSLFFSMFLHAGLLHLLGNMLFLWIYGDNVEHRLGRLRYLICYLATGVAATTTHALLTPDPYFPVVGASGAISGVLGFYFVWFPRNIVKVFVVLFPFFINVVHLPARWVLGFYLLLDNLLPFFLQHGTGGVAHGAHIGGFVGGVVLALVYSSLQQAKAVRGFEGGKDPLLGPVDELVQAAAEGRMRDAAATLLRLPTSQAARVPDSAWLPVARWLEQSAAPEVAAAAYRRYIASHQRGPGLAEAHLGLGRLLLKHGEATTAYQYLLSALELDPTPAAAAEAREALRAIEELQRRRRRLW